MISDKTRRSAFIEQNLDWCIPAPGGSGGEDWNTMTSTVPGVWG